MSYPFVLIRTRLQFQGLPGRPIMYDGITDCLRKIINLEGLQGLYKGIIPNFMKSLPAAAVSYTIFEKIKMFFLSLKTKEKN